MFLNTGVTVYIRASARGPAHGKGSGACERQEAYAPIAKPSYAHIVQSYAAG